MDNSSGKKDSKKKFKNFRRFQRNSNSSRNPKIKRRSLNISQSKNLWKLYFDDNTSEGDLAVMSKLKVVQQYLTCYDENTLLDIYKNRQYSVNVNDFNKSNSLSWPEFLIELELTPNLLISTFGFAMEHIIQEHVLKRIVGNSETASETLPLRKIIPRFTGLSNFLKFQDLKTYNYGHLVTVMGLVVSATDVKPFCTELAFSCNKCQEIQITEQEKGCYTTPNRCLAQGCFSTSFKPLLKSVLTQTSPWKSIRLQELNVNQCEGGRVPRCIDCELSGGLTELCTPGDVVIISGIVDVNNTNEKKGNVGKDANSYFLFVHANSVSCIKGKNVDCVETYCDSLNLKSEDLLAIKEIQSKTDLFELVVASLCPNIFGHELVKAGMVLALFGGASKDCISNDKSLTRENSHVLVVGDPGLGKSQMLLACANVSPRGVFICGNSTSTSGLTVTITKGGGGDNSLEAGALVLADQGHCCIDEFDKMMQQHSALLEAMEQQTISIAKSGVVCTLPARTSIIAVANPSGGHYCKNKTVSENLKINGALLSRFDLVFILQDKPDKVLDDKMSNHVMALHTNKSSQISHHFNPSLNESLNGGGGLKRRLQSKFNEKISKIPHALLQKYITHAKKVSQPKLTPAVCEMLKNFYLEMRRLSNLQCCTPITTRQLESLVRLTKARARVELRSLCKPEDAEDVIEIMKYSMQDAFSDEYGNIDTERLIHGSGMSKSSQAKKLISVLTKAANVKADNCFTISEIKDIAMKNKVTPDIFLRIFESLNDQGFLLKKGFQLYQIQTL